MEDYFMNLTSTPEARDAEFTKLTTKNVNMYTQLRQQENQIRALQAELCNLKVKAETRTTKVKVNSKGGQPYVHEEKQKPHWPTDKMENKYNNKKIVLVAWLWHKQPTHIIDVLNNNVWAQKGCHGMQPNGGIKKQ